MLFLLSSQVWAMPDIMKLDEVQPGMQGTAYTVVDATGEIKTFHVEIITVLDAGKGESKMIIARLSGPVIEAADGLASGMSGSPVYIDGRLVGATSATRKDMDRHTCFITPIEGMLDIWKLPDTKNKTQIHSIGIKKAAAEREKARAALEKKKAALEKKQAAAAVKDKTAAANKAATAGKNAAPDARVTAAPAAEDSETASKDKPAAADEQPSADASAPDSSTAEPQEETAGETAEEPAKETEKEGTKETADETAKETAKETTKETTKETAKETTKDTADKPEQTTAHQQSLGTAAKKELFYASGFGSAGMSFLQQKLVPLGIAATNLGSTPAGGEGQTIYDAVLQPGSSMGVALVYGDLSLGATGTVTAVDGQRVLGFGHTFLHKGDVNYFLTDATVYGTIHGPLEGIKLVSMGNIIGRINQDRELGIAGIVGTFPTVVPLHVTVHDEDQGRTDTYNSMIAYDEDFLPNLSASLTYASMDRTMDRLSGSTAKVHFVIRTNAAEGGKVERDNMYYNIADVGQLAVNELGQALNIICGNTERESDIFDIKVDVTVNGHRRTASLVSAVPDKPEVKPGDTVQFKTTIKPYRRSKEVLTIPYTVPKGQRSGPMRLDLRGGGFIPVAQIILAQQAAAGIDVTADEDKTVSTSDQLKEYLSMDRNNEIVIAPGAAVEPMSEAEQKEAVREAVKASKEAAKSGGMRSAEKGKNPAQTKYATDYIIDNVIHVSLQIAKK